MVSMASNVGGNVELINEDPVDADKDKKVTEMSDNDKEDPVNGDKDKENTEISDNDSEVIDGDKSEAGSTVSKKIRTLKNNKKAAKSRLTRTKKTLNDMLLAKLTRRCTFAKQK